MKKGANKISGHIGVSMSNTEQLKQIGIDIETSGICADLAQSSTQLVLGTGNPDADIVFIGEAPGAKEDELGIPFVGAAGKFLDEMLESVDMDRDSVYITNIVKYRPPENRDPLPSEIDESMPYLLRQLAVIQPKLIATLGRFSMNVFIPKEKIGRIHGQPQRVGLTLPEGVDDPEATAKRKDELVILPLYHPAAALYNGSKRKVLFEDFSQIPKLLHAL